MQSEKWDSQENINSDENDLSSDELDEVLEIRINKVKARLSQNLENGENSEGKGVVGKLRIALCIRRNDILNIQMLALP